MRKLPLLAGVPLLVGAVGVPAAPAFGGGMCPEPITEGRTTTVRIVHACFAPTIAKVPVGSTITWENRSGLVHNMNGPDEWIVEQLPDGSSYSRRFTVAGLYPYACTLHIGMTGIVAVGNANGAPAREDGSVDLGVKTLAAQPGAATAAEAEANASGTAPAAGTGTDTVPAAESTPAEDSGTPVLPWVVGALLALAASALAIGTGRRRTAEI